MSEPRIRTTKTAIIEGTSMLAVDLQKLISDLIEGFSIPEIRIQQLKGDAREPDELTFTVTEAV